MNYEQATVLTFPKNAVIAGIGKVILKSDGSKDYKIPHLHFLMFKGFSDNVLDAINLEYGLHGQGSTLEKVLYDTLDKVVDFFDVNQIDNKEKFKELIKEQDNHILSDYWRLFRKTEMELALEKRDIGSSMVKSVRDEAEAKLLRLIEENMDMKEEIQNLRRFLFHTQKAELRMVA